MYILSIHPDVYTQTGTHRLAVWNQQVKIRREMSYFSQDNMTESETVGLLPLFWKGSKNQESLPGNQDLAVLFSEGASCAG